MPLLNHIARLAAKPMPRTLSPKGHATANYVMAGSCFAGAGLFWPRNKRAAVAALLCGAAELAVTLLTDTQGGAKRAISFNARRDIDAGLAAMFASMPQFLAFKDEKEKGFFLIQGALMAALPELTQFPDERQPAEKNELCRAA